MGMEVFQEKLYLQYQAIVLVQAIVYTPLPLAQI